MWISTFVFIWMVKRVVWAMYQWSRFLKKITFVILTMICPMEMTIKWVWSVFCNAWDPFMNWIIWHQKDVAHNYTLIYPKQIKLLSGCAPIVKYCFKKWWPALWMVQNFSFLQHFKQKWSANVAPKHEKSTWESKFLSYFSKMPVSQLTLAHAKMHN